MGKVKLCLAMSGRMLTVEPPIKDPLNKGHITNNLCTKDTFQCTNNELAYSGSTFLTSKERTTSL